MRQYLYASAALVLSNVAAYVLSILEITFEYTSEPHPRETRHVIRMVPLDAHILVAACRGGGKGRGCRWGETGGGGERSRQREDREHRDPLHSQLELEPETR